MAGDSDGWVAPMLASLAEAGSLASAPPGQWRYERKLDGVRCIAVRRGLSLALWSRNHLPMTGRFPEVVTALSRLAAGSFTLDGEVVAFDGAGRTSFSLLQGSSGAPAVFCAFDLVSLLGRDTTGLDLVARQALLGQLVGDPAPALALVEGRVGDAPTLLRAACEDGWEGLVAKRVAAPYRPGRSRDWRKLKCRADQELVVGGWTDPTGARSGFGALLVGWYDGDQLRYAGKVGTGFDDATLRRLHRRLEALRIARSPFADVAARSERRAHWCRPEVVVAVRFSEWTPDGRLRHPSFMGEREDQDPHAVRRDRT